MALHVVRDVFGEQPNNGTLRGAREALDYRTRADGLDTRDRAFAMELAFGAIRMRRLIDWHLGPFIGDRLHTLPPAIAEVLRLGAYQLVRMHVEPRAAVHESVTLARRYGHKGTAGLVNAVLRRLAESERGEPVRDGFTSDDEYLGTLYSMPTWIVAQWRRRFGDERLEAILAGVDASARAAVTVDARRITRNDALGALREGGIAGEASAYVAESVVLEGSATTPELTSAAAGRWWLQGEAAAMPVDILAPRSGERILEFAAGRGNKTRHIVSRGGDGVFVEAIELDERKARHLRGTLLEFDIANVAVVEGDATVVPEDSARNMHDAVLVDAPCSGLGILGRQPEARWRKDPADGERLAATQAAMLRAAAARVRPGGRIVYSVCSTDEREGEDRIARAMHDVPELERVEMPQRYSAWKTAHGDVLVPPGLDGRDGFFIAQLSRRLP